MRALHAPPAASCASATPRPFPARRRARATLCAHLCNGLLVWIGMGPGESVCIIIVQVRLPNFTSLAHITCPTQCPVAYITCPIQCPVAYITCPALPSTAQDLPNRPLPGPLHRMPSSNREGNRLPTQPTMPHLCTAVRMVRTQLHGAGWWGGGIDAPPPSPQTPPQNKGSLFQQPPSPLSHSVRLPAHPSLTRLVLEDVAHFCEPRLRQVACAVPWRLVQLIRGHL